MVMKREQGRKEMNARRIIKAALLVFVASSMVYLAYQKFLQWPKDGNQAMTGAVAMETKTALPPEIGAVQQKQAHQVIVYYVHTTYRCPTCLKIEEYTKQAIREGFPAQLKDGSLVWKTVDVETKGNEHFIKDYQLFSKAVVVVDMKDNRQVQWKNLKDIWQLVGKKETFTRYINDEVQSYLGKG
jgi:hypothetical protein